MSDKNDKKADITAVAKAAKVSASTVSRYFNHPELLKPSTRKRINSAVRKTGYIRNRAAQTIHGIRSGTIGVLVPTLDHAIFAEVVQAFSDTVDRLGFTILLASHGYDLQREYAILRKFLEHRVDGVVLTGLNHDEAVFQLLDQHHIPSLSMWNYAPNAAFPCIGADNELAGKMIAEHIIALGHTKVACMFPPTQGNDRALARREIVLETLSKANVTVPDAWRLTTVYSISSSKRDTQDLLSQSDRPTALICGNDILATGALYGAKAAGVPVPDGISVVGIGDFKGSADIEPGLTTVRLPAKRIGQEAGEVLARAIVDQTSLTACSRHCEPKLILRRSTKSVHP
ncbi:LacI family DNA-binding transcriptional regulator [Pseudooctadecabacter jejudonensis]|uniref:HTH-type transcriptional repressor PurR n=1 Tax=Pseudooctadecabacter jejudonensis TaxID=1391910 RepID=A0A1Y5SHK5_9RHOB|nr:substrate-binding domain-containing protein [Pseudooctadecabacter jejudonensis]SLN40970.1 HTH-type transcriptional repressor PurR [Pseudooctadecabacter jejudonensis]